MRVCNIGFLDLEASHKSGDEEEDDEQDTTNENVDFIDDASDQDMGDVTHRHKDGAERDCAASLNNLWAAATGKRIEELYEASENVVHVDAELEPSTDDAEKRIRIAQLCAQRGPQVVAFGIQQGWFTVEEAEQLDIEIELGQEQEEQQQEAAADAADRGQDIAPTHANASYVFADWDANDSRVTQVQARPGKTGILIGDPVNPISYMSGFISADNGSDVPVSTIHGVERFFYCMNEKQQPVCVEGAASLERGDKEDHLHVQMVFGLHVPATQRGKDLVVAVMKDCLGLSEGFSTGLKVQLKWFSTGQKQLEMFGYILKGTNAYTTHVCTHNNCACADDGLPHFKFVSRGSKFQDEDYKTQARTAYNQVSAHSIGKERVELTNHNCMRYAYKHYKRNFDPVFVSFLYVLTDMVNSNLYAPSPKMQCGREMDREKAEAAWKCLIKPETSTKDTVATAFFGTQNYAWVHEWQSKEDFCDENPNGNNDYDFEGSTNTSFVVSRTA